MADRSECRSSSWENWRYPCMQSERWFYVLKRSIIMLGSEQIVYICCCVVTKPGKLYDHRRAIHWRVYTIECALIRVHGRCSLVTSHFWPWMITNLGLKLIRFDCFQIKFYFWCFLVFAFDGRNWKGQAKVHRIAATIAHGSQPLSF